MSLNVSSSTALLIVSHKKLFWLSLEGETMDVLLCLHRKQALRFYQEIYFPIIYPKVLSFKQKKKKERKETKLFKLTAWKTLIPYA